MKNLFSFSLKLPQSFHSNDEFVAFSECRQPNLKFPFLFLVLLLSLRHISSNYYVPVGKNINI